MELARDRPNDAARGGGRGDRRRSRSPGRPSHRRQPSASPTRGIRRGRSRSPDRRHNSNLGSGYPPARDPFRSGARDSVLSACAVCLGRHRHVVSQCNSKTRWNGGAARCTRNPEGRICNPNGTQLCMEWQKPKGCTSQMHDSKHECAGCGSASHGAQRCPLAEGV